MKTLTFLEPFTLENGQVLETPTVAYTLHGTPNPDGSNVVWAFHALSGHADVLEWWPGLFGSGKAFDPEHDCIVCATALGSPYSPVRPTSLAFPRFTVRDVARLHVQLAERLHIDAVGTVIGASFGGAQALEFVHAFPGKVDRMVLISCAARESAWGIAQHEAQRLALTSDPSFGLPNGGKRGLAAARAIALLSYRTVELFNRRQTDDTSEAKLPRAASYLQYNGRKFVERFDALCYHYLSHCLDSHDVGRGRGGVQSALRAMEIPTLVVGVDSDQLVPFNEQAKLARWLPQATLKRLRSEYGHDAFLVEVETLHKWVSEFVNTPVLDSDLPAKGA